MFCVRAPMSTCIRRGYCNNNIGKKKQSDCRGERELMAQN